MTEPRTWSWWAGVAVQAMVLGVGLFLASLRMLQLATDAAVFRYQGF